MEIFTHYFSGSFKIKTINPIIHMMCENQQEHCSHILWRYLSTSNQTPFLQRSLRKLKNIGKNYEIKFTSLYVLVNYFHVTFKH